MDPEIRVKNFRVGAGRRRTKLQWLMRIALFGGLVGGTAAAGIGGILYLHYVPTIPEFDSIDDYRPKIGTRIYSNDNQLIGEFAVERRVLVPYDKIPPMLLQAFISAEDKRFYNHGGVDVIGVVQAVLDKLLNPSSKLRRASTITQQVASTKRAPKRSASHPPKS